MIAALEKQLASLKTTVVGGDATGHTKAFSDSRIDGADGGSIPKEPPMCKVSKPYKNRSKWRVRVIDQSTGAIKNHIFDTFEAANAARARLEREYRRPVGVPFPEALDAYQTHLATEGNITSRGPNKPRSIETTLQRLRSVFRTEIITGDLTAAVMMDLWGSWATGKAVDTSLNTLAQVRTFLAWLEKRGWTKGVPTAEIKVIGKRKKGKPKLSQDEAETLVKWCLANPSKEATVTLMAYWLGLRASEIVARQVRDIDGRGTLLDIPQSKTEAGERTIKLPVKLQPLLGELAKGKKPDDRLFGDEDRFWVRRVVRACCKAAGVRVVCPHGLRGTHAKVAREVGVSGVLLAAAMGHEDENTTTAHYAGRAAVAQSQIDRVTASLN
jgi:integrase